MFVLDTLEQEAVYNYTTWNPDYMEKVVRDAFRSERRTGEVVIEIGSKDGVDYITGIYGSGFLRVERRILYRLKNNSWIGRINTSYDSRVKGSRRVRISSEGKITE